MNVLFLEKQPCIRALKYAEGFRNTDNNLFFAYEDKTLTELYGQGDELFNRWVKLRQKTLEKQLTEIVNSENVKLIHSHNAPDFLTGVSIDLFKGRIPIIHDVHDLISSRTTPYGLLDPLSEEAKKAEKKAVTESDGLIYATQGIKELSEQTYSIDGKPSIIFESYVPRSLIPQNLNERLSKNDGELHIVYEGSLDINNKGSHYDLLDIFKKIASQKIHIHVYSSKEDSKISERFRDNGKYFHYHGHLSPSLLLQEIARYDYGWAGFNNSRNGPHLDTVLANKIMEYVACGLPGISFEHKTQKDFIDKHKIGIVIKGVNGLKEVLMRKDLEKIRENVLAIRYKFTIENNIRAVMDFYEKVGNDHLDKSQFHLTHVD